MTDEELVLPGIGFVPHYRELLSWDFRRPAWPIHPPAFVRHLGYWFVDEIGHDKRREAFLNFSHSIEQNSDFVCLAPSAFPPPDIRYQTCRLESDKWESLPANITLELHHEYITVSIVIELRRFAAMKPQEFSLASKLVNAIHHLEGVLTERRADLSKRVYPDKPGPMKNVRGELKDTYPEIFSELWARFDREILAKSSCALIGSSVGKFADFRGFIASAGVKEQIEGAKEPFFEFDAPPPSRTKPPEPFEPNDSIQRAHCILPFMTADSHTIEEGVEKEITICRFLDGRCIYASALGAHPPEDKDKSEQPITFFLLTNAISSWQTGRLIDCMNTLGMVRLAARRFLREISVAGNDLHNLGRDMLERIDPQIRDLARFNFVTTEFSKQLSHASSELHRIRKSIPGGLSYRVERSRYYRGQFQTLIAGLRLERSGRIEGFQPYGEFVERRFGTAYDFIDMVGKRYDRIEHQLSVFYQRVRIAETARLQAQITIQTERIEKLQKQTTKGTERIENLQERAEIGFFVFLVPYYLSGVLIHIFLPFLLNATWITRLIPPDPKGPEGVIETGLTVIATSFALFLLWLLRWYAKRPKPTKAAEQETAVMQHAGKAAD